MEKPTYKYQPLDDFSNANAAEETSVHDKLIESYELDAKEHESIFKTEHNDDDSDDHLKKKGLSVWTASIFIIGEICGAGALAFPLGLSKSGLYGLILIFLVIIMSTYCGLLLGQSWVKVKEQRGDAGPIRDPFPYIGEVAVNKYMRHAVTICVNLQLFLTCVVYLLLASKIMSSFVSFHIGTIHDEKLADLRIWVALIALVLFPFMLLGTPKDFWFVAVAAAASTTIALVLVWIKYSLIVEAHKGAPVPKAAVTVLSFSSAFGTFVFGFTGASLFPTIQSDMKDPGNFAKSIYVGYGGIALLYIPTAIGGYIALGGDLKASVVESLSDYDKSHGTNRAIVSVAELLFAGHFLSGFVLMINPSLQQLEEYFNVPYEFSKKRMMYRGGVLLAILATAEIFPRFGPIVDLVGGSINVAICFIFPIWFYLRLNPDRKIIEKIVLSIVVIIGVIGGVCATISNVKNVIHTFGELYAKKSNNATVH